MAEATTLSLLTWNTSDGTPSNCAPFAWGVEGQRAGIVSVVKSAWPLPDLVCLQEIDAPPEQQGGLVDRMVRVGYTAHGEAHSHRGACTTFVRRDSGIRVLGDATVGPAVLLKLALPERMGGGCLTLANCHLAPSEKGGAMRIQQVKAVAQEAARAGNGATVLAGDMNMRKQEGGAKLCRELGIQDAWEAAGSSADNRFTWDTKRNRYYQDGFEYTARYDRIFLRGDVECVSFQLVGHHPLNPEGGGDHYLSDHFGILVELACNGNVGTSEEAGARPLLLPRAGSAPAAARATAAAGTSAAAATAMSVALPDPRQAAAEAALRRLAGAQQPQQVQQAQQAQQAQGQAEASGSHGTTTGGSKRRQRSPELEGSRRASEWEGREMEDVAGRPRQRQRQQRQEEDAWTELATAGISREELRRQERLLNRAQRRQALLPSDSGSSSGEEEEEARLDSRDGPSPDTELWSCPACTFDNEWSNDTCECCGVGCREQAAPPRRVVAVGPAMVGGPPGPLPRPANAAAALPAREAAAAAAARRQEEQRTGGQQQQQKQSGAVAVAAAAAAAARARAAEDEGLEMVEARPMRRGAVGRGAGAGAAAGTGKAVRAREVVVVDLADSSEEEEGSTRRGAAAGNGTAAGPSLAAAGHGRQQGRPNAAAARGVHIHGAALQDLPAAAAAATAGHEVKPEGSGAAGAAAPTVWQAWGRLAGHDAGGARPVEPAATAEAASREGGEGVLAGGSSGGPEAGASCGTLQVGQQRPQALVAAGGHPLASPIVPHPQQPQAAQAQAVQSQVVRPQATPSRMTSLFDAVLEPALLTGAGDAGVGGSHTHMHAQGHTHSHSNLDVVTAQPTVAAMQQQPLQQALNRVHAIARGSDAGPTAAAAAIVSADGVAVGSAGRPQAGGVTGAGAGSELGPGGAAAAASGAPKRSLKDLLARGALKSLLEPSSAGA